MNATQIVLKSGTSVVVYHEEDDYMDSDVVKHLLHEDVAYAGDATLNIKNEATWLTENAKTLKDRMVKDGISRVKARVMLETMEKQGFPEPKPEPKSKLLVSK